jgi:hypothetical protein
MNLRFLFFCIYLMVFSIYAIDTVRAEILMIDIQTTKQRLQDHVKMLTITIGERSVLLPGNLEKTRYRCSGSL